MNRASHLRENIHERAKAVSGPCKKQASSGHNVPDQAEDDVDRMDTNDKRDQDRKDNMMEEVVDMERNRRDAHKKWMSLQDSMASAVEVGEEQKGRAWAAGHTCPAQRPLCTEQTQAIPSAQTVP